MRIVGGEEIRGGREGSDAEPEKKDERDGGGRSKGSRSKRSEKKLAWLSFVRG